MYSFLDLSWTRSVNNVKSALKKLLCNNEMQCQWYHHLLSGVTSLIRHFPFSDKTSYKQIQIQNTKYKIQIQTLMSLIFAIKTMNIQD